MLQDSRRLFININITLMLASTTIKQSYQFVLPYQLLNNCADRMNMVIEYQKILKQR